MTDLMGVAAIIAACGTVLVSGYAQYNTRKDAREAKAAALDAKAAIEAAARESKHAIEAQNVVMAEQGATLASAAHNIDGGLSAVKAIADRYEAEVLRLAQGGAPTPVGEPTAETPVTLTAGKPATMKPEKP